MGSTVSQPAAAAPSAEIRAAPPSPPASATTKNDHDAVGLPLPHNSAPQQQQQSSSPPAPPPQITPPPSPTPSTYTFPTHGLKRRLTQAGKTPLVLVACGSFSPITKLHVQMFELATRHIPRTEFEIVGNYLSPCSDAYNKPSLVPAHHRLEMCSLAVANLATAVPVQVDDWEATRVDASGRPLYSCTADVLRHFDSEINERLGGIQTAPPSGGPGCGDDVDVDVETNTDSAPHFVKARIMLLIGADLALTMSNPTLWAPADIDVLLGYYGAFIVERPHQTDIQAAIQPLQKYSDNIWVVDAFENDVSSTKVRAQIHNREVSMDIPGAVFKYIKLHRLYLD